MHTFYSQIALCIPFFRTTFNMPINCFVENCLHLTINPFYFYYENNKSMNIFWRIGQVLCVPYLGWGFGSGLGWPWGLVMGLCKHGTMKSRPAMERMLLKQNNAVNNCWPKRGLKSKQQFCVLWTNEIPPPIQRAGELANLSLGLGWGLGWPEG